jgi:N-acetylglutamate synthase-like GNAT family acetyltransferase
MMACSGFQGNAERFSAIRFVSETLKETEFFSEIGFYPITDDVLASNKKLTQT